VYKGLIIGVIHPCRRAGGEEQTEAVLLAFAKQSAKEGAELGCYVKKDSCFINIESAR
jgi:hypothetical protein